MNTIAINQSFTKKLPYWSELENLSKDDKIKLIAMLSLSITNKDDLTSRKESAKVTKLEQAMALLDNMMSKDGNPVPVDEECNGALARTKYSI